MREAQVKAALVDHLLAKEEDIGCIATELPFHYAARRADIARINHKNITAFEIKSDVDNFGTLKSQIKDYTRTFDYVYVVLGNKHISKDMLQYSQSIGLLVITEDMKIKMIREAKQLHPIKRNLLSMLTKEMLISEMKNYEWINKYSPRVINTSDLQKLISIKLTLVEIESLVRNSLLKKYMPQFEQFLSERGEKTHIEDLKLLTLQKSVLTQNSL